VKEKRFTYSSVEGKRQLMSCVKGNVLMKGKMKNGKGNVRTEKGAKEKGEEKASCKEKRQLRREGEKRLTYSSVEDKRQLMSCVKRNV
jgi:hypothetical protein